MSASGRISSPYRLDDQSQRKLDFRFPVLKWRTAASSSMGSRPVVSWLLLGGAVGHRGEQCAADGDRLRTSAHRARNSVSDPAVEERGVDPFGECPVPALEGYCVERVGVDADREGGVGVADQLRDAVDVDASGDQLRCEVVATLVERVKVRVAEAALGDLEGAKHVSLDQRAVRRRQEDTTVRRVRRPSPIGEGAMDAIDHRDGPACSRRLGRLDCAGAVVGVLDNVDAAFGEIDVSPFQAEGFADAQTREEAEDGDRPVARRRETRFPHLGENVGDFAIGVDVAERDGRVIVARGAADTEVAEGIAVDEVLLVEPTEHVAHRRHDVTRGRA